MSLSKENDCWSFIIIRSTYGLKVILWNLREITVKNLREKVL